MKKKRKPKKRKGNRVVRRIRRGKETRKTSMEVEALAFTNVRWTGDIYANVRYPVCFDFDGGICRV